MVVALDLGTPRPATSESLELMFDDEREVIDAAIATVVSRLTFETAVPSDRVGEQRLKANELGMFQARASQLRRLLQEESKYANALRVAAGLLCDALGARQGGTAITFALVSMEALLLEKSSSEAVQARLSEAVAYFLGEDAQKREQLRERVKKLYKVRSTFVHTGESDERERWNALRLAVRVLRRELGSSRPRS